MTRFAFTLIIILAGTLTIPDPAAAGTLDPQSVHPIHAEELTLGEGSTPVLITTIERLDSLYWTVFSGEQVSFVIRVTEVEGPTDREVWEGSVESGDSRFGFADDGPKWLLSELTAEPGCYGIDLALVDRSGEAGPPVTAVFCLVADCPPHESDEGLAAWGKINAIDEEWETDDTDAQPALGSDQGIAAWGECSCDDMFPPYEQSSPPSLELDQGLIAMGLEESVDVSWAMHEEAGPSTHEVDHGLAAWGDIEDVDVEWEPYL